MLDDRIINVLVERLVNRIEQGNTYILEEIGNCIKQIGTLTPSKAQQLAQILKYGGNYDKIAKKLAQITELNVKDIYDLFDNVAKENQVFAKQFYDYRNIKYIPYEKNIALQNQVRALASITANEYINLSRTTAFVKKDIYGNSIYTNLTETYRNAIDEAVLNVSQGKTDFNSSMYKTIKELGESGIRTVDYQSGYSRRMDSAVRMNMQGALRNLSNTLQEQFGEEFGADGVEISVHSNPAEDHEEAQGRQFSNDEFKKLQEDGVATDYKGKVIDLHKEQKDGKSVSFRPISEYNCYHYIFSIVLGISKPNYNEEKLEQINKENHKGFELDGKHYSIYQGTQLQRKLETEVRKAKDTQIIAKKSGNKELVDESQKRITQLTQKYNELSSVSGLPTKVERMRVSGYKRVNVNKM
jgi:hypothetical protein